MAWHNRLRNLFRRDPVREEIGRELEFHLQERIDRLIESGMNEAEARHAARRRFGNLGLQLGHVHQSRSIGWLESVADDAGLALRGIRKDLSLTIAVVAVLAIGIGLNTGVFTLVNAAAYRPPVERDPDSFFRVDSVAYQLGEGGFSSDAIFLSDYEAIRNQARSVRDLAGWYPSMAPLTDDDPGDTIALSVTCNFFRLHTLEQAEMGRLLRPDDCTSASPVMVLSYEAWNHRFGRDPEIVGRRLHYNGKPVTVVGVTPRSFAGRIFTQTQAWFPYTLDSYLEIGTEGSRLQIGGRLQQGYTLEEASAELRLLVTQQDALHPGRTTRRFELSNGSLASSRTFRSGRYIIPILIGIMGLFLLVACTTAATLLLARAVDRQHEVAIRLALGAGRLRLLRMFATESLVVTVVSAAAGWLIAWRIPGALWSLFEIPYTIPLLADRRVFLYLAGITLLTALLAGLSPAVEALHPRIAETLQRSRRLFGRVRRPSWRREALIGAQVALTFVLLVLCGMFVQARNNAFYGDVGFPADELLMADLRPLNDQSADWAGFQRDLRERVAAMPGVRSVAFTTGAPGFGGGTLTNTTPDGERLVSDFDLVSPQFFETSGIAILRGRSLLATDAGVEPRPVVVTAEMAQAVPTGRELLGWEMESYVVVGVAASIDLNADGEAERPAVYELMQEDREAPSLIVRFEGPPDALIPAVRTAIQELAPATSVDARTVRAMLDDRFSTLTSFAALLTPLAGISLAMALVGVYGAVSYAVKRRRKEVAIQTALGAGRGALVRAVVIPGSQPVAAGLVAGAGLAWAAAVWMGKSFFGVAPADVPTGVAVAILLCCAALAAMAGPARRATRADPAEALREE